MGCDLRQVDRLTVLDAARVAAEIAQRQVYFRSPRLMRWREARHRRRSPAPQVTTVSELKDALRGAGLSPGALAMVHTSIRGLSLSDLGPGDEAATAPTLLDLLVELLGPAGTLVMPTHPLYRADRPYHDPSDKQDLVLRYDPQRTPSRVGLVNEIFRQMPGAKRSRHPLQTLSARGPLAEGLLADNLGPGRALPHGVQSGYYRLCVQDGLVVSIGVPLITCLTMVHVGEDVRDVEWPLHGFFRERHFLVRDGDRWDEHTVRERRPLFARSYCEGQLHRDLLREGILREGMAGTVRVDGLRAADLLAFLMRRNAGNTYPYFGAEMALL
jgi:aminoglycoside N3'-acetyltransferase